MKLKNVLLTLGLALGVGAGVGAAVGANSMKTPIETNASFSSDTRRIYINLGASWWVDGTHDQLNGFGCHYWNGSGDANVKITSHPSYVGLEYLYYVDIPVDATNFLFMAYKDDTPWWNNQYQTVDTSFQDGKDLIEIHRNDGDQDWYKYDITWGKLHDSEEDAVVYFVNGASWNTPHVHYWGASKATAWPGEAMTLVEDIKLYAGGNFFTIWKYTVDEARYLKFTDGAASNTAQTGDLEIEDNGVYFMTVEGKYRDVVELLLLIESSLGKANIVSDNNKEYSNTICAINGTTKTAIISKYESLAGSSDEYIANSAKNSVLVTYDPTDYSSTTEVELKAICAQLNTGTLDPTLYSLGLTILGDSPSNILVVITVFTAILAVGGFFFLRRRKEN